MVQLNSGKTFRVRLREELKRRSQVNPNYSLRSFARSLGISPSGLSSALSGKNPISLKFIQRIAPKLKLSPSEAKRFQIEALNEFEPIGSQKEYQVISQDLFEVIKDWYHYAILNLMRTKSFRPSAFWIAKRLGLSLGEIQTAIERLQAVQLLQIDTNGWKDVSTQFTTHTNNKKFSKAAKDNQVQLFEKAKKAIEEVAFENRNHTGVTIAFRKKDLEKAKDRIAQFRKEFTIEFDQQLDADEVYQICIALFPLSQLNKD